SSISSINPSTDRRRVSQAPPSRTIILSTPSTIDYDLTMNNCYRPSSESTQILLERSAGLRNPPASSGDPGIVYSLPLGQTQDNLSSETFELFPISGRVEDIQVSIS